MTMNRTLNGIPIADDPAVPEGAVYVMSPVTFIGAGPDLTLWTVYDHPADYPGKFVARRWVAFKGLVAPTAEHAVCATLEPLRGFLARKGLMRQERQQGDDPCIVEVWL